MERAAAGAARTLQVLDRDYTGYALGGSHASHNLHRGHDGCAYELEPTIVTIEVLEPGVAPDPLDAPPGSEVDQLGQVE